MGKKTVKAIEGWFASECEEILNETPAAVKNMANKNEKMLEILAESIARKKAFRKGAVLKYLKFRKPL